MPFSSTKPRMGPTFRLADLFGPHHEHVGDRAVADPHLAAAELVAAMPPFGRGWPCCRGRSHGRVRSGRSSRSIRRWPAWAGTSGAGPRCRIRRSAPSPTRTCTLIMRAVATIHALDFAGDQAIGHVVQAGAAVGLPGSVGPSRPNSPISRKMAGSVLLVAEGLRSRGAAACPGSRQRRHRAPCARRQMSWLSSKKGSCQLKAAWLMKCSGRGKECRDRSPCIVPVQASVLHTGMHLTHF